MDNLWDLVKDLKASKSYTADRTIGIINDRAVDNGFQLKGEGSYSTVIYSPVVPDKVIKVTGSKVDRYHTYIDWLFKYGYNLSSEKKRHLPKIHRTVTHNGFRITLMEKLNGHGEIEEGDVEDTYFATQEIILRYAREKNIRVDMGRGVNGRNIMWRDEVVPVFTDPWAHGVYE